MNSSYFLSKTAAGLAILTLVSATHAGETDLSTVPLSTYYASSSTDVKPNILFVLDDSGSMAWDYMPDQTGWYDSYNDGYQPSNYTSLPPFWRYNAAFNGVAYNPAIRYRPPAYFDVNGDLDTTTYPSMTGVSTATGGDGTASVGSPNWKAVKHNGFAAVSGTSNREGNAYSYVVVAGEYCTGPDLRICTTASAPSVTYPYSAGLRWCNSSALTNCRVTWSDGNRFPRLPVPRMATIGVGSGSSTNVSGITVGGLQIMSASSGSDDDSSDLADKIRDKINSCTNTITGNCTVVGYSATASGSTVTIYAPGNTSATPVVTVGSGSKTFTPSSFAHGAIPYAAWRDGASTSSGAIPGENYRYTITSTINSYAFPGTAVKAPTRTDCAGATCTYQEEMTNYANWYAYYRTRMQLMKSGVSHAFSEIDSPADIAAGTSRFRVGFLTLNNNGGNKFVNLDEFKTGHKKAWYDSLFSASPSSGTPLRNALSIAGQLYAGKYNASTLNGVTVTDPLQYSCQQNFTILSSDGFWNGAGGVRLDGASIGNEDSGMARPYNDGGVATTQSKTSYLQTRTQTQRAEMGTLQTQTSQLQMRTSQLQGRAYSQLQTRYSSNGGSSWGPGWVDVAPGSTCVWDNKGSTRRQCRYDGNSWESWVDEPVSCTAVAVGSGSSGTWRHARQCQYESWSAWSSTATCSTVSKDLSSPHTKPVARECTTAVVTAFADSPTCVVSGPDGTGLSTQCQYRWDAAAATQTCTPAYVGGNYTNATVYRNCTSSTYSAWTNVASCTVTDTWDVAGTKTHCQYTAWPGSWTTVASCTPVSQSTPPTYSVGEAVQCQTVSSGGASNTLADVAAYYYKTDLRSPDAGDNTGTCDGPVIPPAVLPNDLCENNVPPYGRDVAATQHMTTFTLGLGALGEMLFSPTYWTDVSGDFASVATGASADSGNGVCSWQSNGSTCNWPTPGADKPANIDDMWHAAVNGRGAYFSAKDPDSLASGLAATLAAIVNTPRPGTSAAAASSNPNISAGDNYIFSSYYKSVDWYGELYRQRLDLETKDLTPGVDWSARSLIDCATTVWVANKAYVAGDFYRDGTSCYYVQSDYVSGATFGSADTDNVAVVTYVPGTCSAWAASTDYAVGDLYSYGGSCHYVIKAYTSGATFASQDRQNANLAVVAGSPTSRTIYTKVGSSLADFTWGNLSVGQQEYFKKANMTLTQFCTPGDFGCLSATAQDNFTIATGGAAGEALVNFLRGDRSNEGTFYRTRKHVLGDIVSSEARYVKTPLFAYTDSNYSAYKTLMDDRQGVVYVASNGGMLHAFHADTGKELWAYVPELILPRIHLLADADYENNHQYMVDGTPEVGDVCPSAPGSICTAAEWKTIIVGGLNRGGKGYYALDITDPASPQLLWEFTHAQMGYSYGNPRITKRKDGTWVVLLTSGYNNADGQGRLFVLNAYTGVLLDTINTGVGSAGTPSGLAKISAHSVTSQTNNTTSAVYGGDMLGNLWRFDINGDIGAIGKDAHLLVSLKDALGDPQPITAKPVVATINGSPVITVGTGSYLGVSDVSNPQKHSMYAIKDNLNTVTLDDPRETDSGFVKQTLVAATCDVGMTGFCEPGETVRKIDPALGVDWTDNNGWYLDFLTAGERASTDPALSLGTLAFTTITPNNASVEACGEPGADTAASFFYAVDYRTGNPVAGSGGVVGVSLGNVIATRPVIVRLSDGTVLALIRVSGGSPTGSGAPTGMGTVTPNPVDKEDPDTKKMNPPINPSSSGTRRVSWREIID